MLNLRKAVHGPECGKTCTENLSPNRRDILRSAARQTMQIGEPVRIIVVEPLEHPVKEPEVSLETVATEPDPEKEPATK